MPEQIPVESTLNTYGRLSGSLKTRGVLTGSISTRGRLVGQVGGAKIGEEDYESYMLVFEDGTEFPAVFVENKVVFTATENDIRKGTVAATSKGVTEGTKEIPAYHTTEGFKVVPSGSRYVLSMQNYDYTKLQAIVCAFNTTLTNSIAAEKVVINDGVYRVASTEEESTVIIDTANKRIDLGLVNETDKIVIIRYFSYKEIY